jgi:hypothetical protein
MDKELLKKILRESTLSEAKPVGLALTDKVKGEDKKENDAYYKEVEKKMSDYEKASTSSSPDAIEEPKFNYGYEDEVEYHEDMEIRNGMEMLNYERKPSEKFSQRAKEGIEGSSNMGNNPEWANVYPEQQGFTGPEFGKKLVKTIERSKAKRDAATPTLDQFGDDIEEKNVGVNKTKSAYKPKVTKKPVAIQESKTTEEGEMYGFMGEGSGDNINPKYTHFAIDKSTGEVVNGWEYEPEEDRESIKYYCKMDLEDMFPDRKPSEFKVLTAKALTKQGIDPFNSDNWQKMGINEFDVKPKTNNNKTVIKEFNWPKSTLSSTFSQILYNELNKTFPNRYFIVIGKDLYLSQPHGDKKLLTINSDTDSVESIIGKLNNLLTYNKSEIKESTKMKRLKFKKPFNGIETALKVIPESYKVDNKVFEMTDGNENYKIRWEGSLTEGKAVVLTAYDKTLVKEDMDKIKHLMGFKSQETLGNLKGKQRIEENNIFADMLKKTRTLMTEGEDVKKKGLTEGATNDLMVAAKAGTLGSDIDTIVAKNGKHEVIKAMQVLMNNGLIDAEGMRKIGLMQRIQKMTEGEAKGEVKPDFLDLDGDGNKTEPMKDAAEDAKEKPVTKGEGVEHLQELSPETYDKVRDAGLERDDSKGKELAKTANELKYRDVIGKAVKYLSKDGFGQEGKVDEIKELRDHVEIIIWDGNKMDHMIIFKDSNDVKVGGIRMEVDRATANVLAKVKKLAFGVESKANDFKQLA